MPLRAVIFDLMDVLVLVGDAPERRAYEARIGVAEGMIHRAMLQSPVFRAAIAGQATEETLWRDVAAALGVDGDEWRTVARAASAAHTLNSGLVTFIRTLRPRYITAILTNTPVGVRRWGIERFGLDREVDQIIVSAEEGLHKPQPEFFLLAARRLDIAPSEALFVDDEARYVAAAEAVGMRGIQFRDTAQAVADVRALLAASPRGTTVDAENTEGD
jgi:putative hydrolase of the HAD superfamily